MLHKKIVKTWLFIVVLGLLGAFIASIIVDPLDILGTPIIRGVNNYKDRQDSYLDVFKPYHIVKYKPEIIFIGSSRVYYAWEPILEGYDKEKVYNMGFSSLPLNNMEKYLDFVYSINEPKKIFIGLDFFQFGKENFNDAKRNFSEERLKKLSGGDVENVLLESLKENFQVSHLLRKTVKESFKNRNELEVFERGWYASRGNCKDLNEKAYYGSMDSYFNTYRDWEYEEKSVEFLERIVEKAREKGIEVFVFFNPISVDLSSLIYVFGLQDDLSNIKRKVVNIVGEVYDFNYINAYTANRHKLYYDPSHSNKIFGDIVKNDIITGNDTERLTILNSTNVEYKLRKEYEMNHAWWDANEEYIEYLRNRIKDKRKLQQGELKEFIGF